MESMILLGLIFTFTTVFGFYLKNNFGTFKHGRNKDPFSFKPETLFGKFATIILFSTEFCSNCAQSKSALIKLTKLSPGVKFIEVKAESDFNIFNKLKIFTTPTIIILDYDKKEVARATGPLNMKELEKIFNSLGLKLKKSDIL